jgi:ABC-type phosphate transport system auxiliary subunit
MTDLLAQINELLDSSARDLGKIEHTLTDGYAYALSLDAERWRLEKRATTLTQELQRGDTAEKARELSEIAERLEANAADLDGLRALLADLRRHADGVRVGSPSQ